MTFFANSGIAWPKYEEDSRRAGTMSLDAISQVWQLFASLEARSERFDGNVDGSSVSHSADSFQKAAGTYYRMADGLEDVFIDHLSGAEVELAGINLPNRRFYDGPYSDWLGDLFSRGSIPIGRVYKELAQRAEHLSSSIRAIEIRRDNSILAPQVFQIMKQLETLAILGRIVAVLNLRRPEENKGNR